MKDQNLTSENLPHGVPGCTRELELKSQPATFADIVAAIGLLGIATTLCIANMPCHAGELSFPLSWQHAQRFQFANLSTWVAPTVQWPYTALIVLSRNLTSSPLLLPKVAALLAFATTLGLIRAIPSERCSCLGSRLAATLFFVQYLHTVVLPSHDPLAGVASALAIYLLFNSQQPRPLLAGLALGLGAAVKISVLALAPGLTLALAARGGQSRRSLGFATVGVCFGFSLVGIPNLIEFGSFIHTEQAAITWRNALEHSGMAIDSSTTPASFIQAFRLLSGVMFKWWLDKFMTFIPLLCMALILFLIDKSRRSFVRLAFLAPVLILTPLADDDQRYLYIVAPIECIIWSEAALAFSCFQGQTHPWLLRCITGISWVVVSLNSADSIASLTRWTEQCRSFLACTEDLNLTTTGQIDDRWYDVHDPNLQPLMKVSIDSWCSMNCTAAPEQVVVVGSVDEARKSCSDRGSPAPWTTRTCTVGSWSATVLRRPLNCASPTPSPGASEKQQGGL